MFFNFLKKERKIKTRFAPSPTGYLHIGGLRTALYNYFYAKQHQGEFVLRIEDTDQKREVKGAVEALIITLQKMGLDWDSGPVLNNNLNLAEKGQNGPFLQSKRVDLYQEYSKELIGQGKAYFCFCTEERLAKLRADQEANKQAPRYDGLCRNLTPDEVEENLKQSKSKVIRLKVPENREVIFKDLIRGEVKFNTKEIDDQVLIKSDGFPTYHLANVVDDHLMEITHVIRGEEWLSSTPKHLLLYEAFGWQQPDFAHLPLLLNPDKSKLSKRQGDVAVEDYLAKGYLPEALINYVALLGWHPQDNPASPSASRGGQEFFSLEQLVKEFSLERVQKAGAVFDLEKLNWFNSYYIKQLSDEDLVVRCKEFLPDADKNILLKILKIEKERLNNLSEIGEKAKMFLDLPDYNSEILIFKKSTKETMAMALKKVLEKLNSISDWQAEKIKACLTEVVGENNLTNGDVFWPTRVAVSGAEKSPSPEDIMEVLGKEEGLTRIKIAIDKL